MAGGKVEATDWMPDEYRTGRPAVRGDARQQRADGCPARARVAHARTDPAPQAGPHREGPGRGRARPAPVSGGRGPRQDARGDVRRPAGRQDQVPQRLPLPDGRLGRCRDDRLARRCGRDRRPAGAARQQLRAVRADDAQDLLGGVRPHHARPRCRRDHGDRDGRAASGDPGRARALVGPADADARSTVAPGEGPRPALADQGEDLRGAAPGVPDDLRARGSGSSGSSSRTRTCAWDADAATWRYREPDWDELRTVVTNHGPMSEARLEFRRVNREETRWVREAILGVAAAA